MDPKRCPKCGETKDATSANFYRDKNSSDGLGCWCKTCTNAIPKAQTRTRILRNRARHRALQMLVERHRAEFQEIYENCRAEAIEQDERLAMDPENAAKFDAQNGQTVRLKPGRRKVGETPEARVNQDWCPKCSSYHAQGHQCPTCKKLAGRGVNPGDLVVFNEGTRRAAMGARR